MKKVITLVFTTCFLASLLTYTYHISASLGRAEYAEYSISKGYSYIISNDGAAVAALSGTTGVIDYFGTNASTVIQLAIGALTSGTIFIENAIYSLDHALEGKSHVSLVSDGATLKVAGQVNAISLINVNNVNQATL